MSELEVIRNVIFPAVNFCPLFHHPDFTYSHIHECHSNQWSCTRYDVIFLLLLLFVKLLSNRFRRNLTGLLYTYSWWLLLHDLQIVGSRIWGSGGYLFVPGNHLCWIPLHPGHHRDPAGTFPFCEPYQSYCHTS